MCIKFLDKLDDVLDDVRDMLISKNLKYGNSALDPIRIFSKLDSIAGLKVRIDDKISRLKNEQGDEDEDVEWDLLGYLIMLRIAKKYEKN